jgi:hypothetical protein
MYRLSPAHCPANLDSLPSVQLFPRGPLGISGLSFGPWVSVQYSPSGLSDMTERRSKKDPSPRRGTLVWPPLLELCFVNQAYSHCLSVSKVRPTYRCRSDFSCLYVHCVNRSGTTGTTRPPVQVGWPALAAIT